MTEEGVLKLYEEFHTPLHIREHCLQVARVAKLLAEELANKGEDVDINKVWIAGLAHDFIRIVDFKKNPTDLGSAEDRLVWTKLRETYQGHHGDVGALILEEMGEPDLAEIIRKHKHSAILDDPPTTWEEKIIYYADKRVSHSNIVSVFERLDEGFKRHFPNQKLPEIEQKRRQKIMELENEIFSKINLTPEDIKIKLGEV